MVLPCSSKKQVIDQIGLIPEEYFLYYEELEWCTRMTAEGYELWYDPAFEIWHKDGSSSGKGSPLQCYYLSRNRLLYAYRNLPGWRLYLALLYQLVIVCPKKHHHSMEQRGKKKNAAKSTSGRQQKAFFQT